MDGSAFDRLTRMLTTAGSRRRTLGGVLAGVLGHLAHPQATGVVAHDTLNKCKKIENAKKRKACVKKAKAHATDHANETRLPGPACVPACGGRVCGDDGCGGSCGSCGAGRRCDAAGRCVCVPQCTGRTCGPDGCGGQCGTCRDVETCQEGSCTCAAPGPGDICGSAAECCAYTALDERSCDRGAGGCSSFLPVCRYGEGGRCSSSCDCMRDLVCVNGSCVCPDGRDYLGRGGCCAAGLTRCGDRCCPPGTCLCIPLGDCRCLDPL